MRKISTYLALLILPTLLLSACGSKRPSLEDRIGSGPESDLIRDSYEGTLEALPRLDIYEGGTHQLITDSDGAILLQSATINLSRYLDEEVRVEGVMEEGIGNAKDVFSVSGIEYLDESRNDELSDFESDVFGFRFTHPKPWIPDVQGDSIHLKLTEDTVVTLDTFEDEDNLEVFVSSQEETEGTEVTVGAQRSLRFIKSSSMIFYVPNPPKERIYKIVYAPTVNKVDEPEKAEAQLGRFYDLLDSFGIIYGAKLTGEACGGLQKLECPEDYICQLEDDTKYADGVCVPLGGGELEASCPYIAPPSGCNEYRISEYSLKGCPSRYECLGEGDGQVASFRDLNVVDAGMNPEDREMVSDTSEDENGSQALDEPVSISEEADYEVPDVSEVTYEYLNTRKNFSLLMPRTWYFASFGPVDGTLWKVGFADFGLEEPGEAIITLAIEDEPGGRASKKIDDEYFNFYGPSDLKEVMDEMADSAESF